jgi:tripartite-type tricarboxylate transporter receptor subunit TctC
MTAIRWLAAWLGLFVFSCGIVWAQAYPSKPVRVVIVFPPGGATDIVGRIAFQKVGEQVNQQFVIDNRVGAGGTIGAAYVAKSPPDGYTVMVYSTTLLANAHLYRKLPYEALRDFVGITPVARLVSVLVVHPSMPVRTTKEFIALARARPGDISYGSAGVGALQHLSMSLLASTANLKMVHVPYKGGGPAIQDLVAGHIPISFGTTPATLPHSQAGTIRILALAEVKRSPDLPGVPTISETVAGVDTFTWVGVFAPLGTPKPIVDRVNAIIADAIKKPDVIAKLKTQGATAAGGTPEDLQKSMQEEFNHWAKVIPSIGLKPE